MSLAFVEAHPAGFSDVAYIENNDGVFLATCGKDGKLCYRSAENPSEIIKEIATQEAGEDACPLTSVIASPSGDRVSIADEQNFVKVWHSLHLHASTQFIC